MAFNEKATFSDALRHRELAKRFADELDTVAYELSHGAIEMSALRYGTRRWQLLVDAAAEMRLLFKAGEDEGVRRAVNSEGRC